MCNLHWCYTFCTGVTLFALVLHLNCTALSQSESSKFFMCIINGILRPERVVLKKRQVLSCQFIIAQIIVRVSTTLISTHMFNGSVAYLYFVVSYLTVLCRTVFPFMMEWLRSHPSLACLQNN